MNDFGKKLWAIKKEAPKFKKTKKGFKFKYVDLETIEKKMAPILEKNKVGYYFQTHTFEGKNVLGIYIFDEDSDCYKTNTLSIPDNIELKGMNGYQSLGSALTYFRRYLLVVSFGLTTEDDVDAISPSQVEKVEIDHLAKIKQLISIGRKKTALVRYLDAYKDQISEEVKASIQELINQQKS